MSTEIYLDNSATTCPCPETVQAVSQSLTECWYNPSALYGKAFQAEKIVTTARKTVAASLGAEEKNVIFTSGGTESDHLAIFGLCALKRKKGDILYSAAEHPAVKNNCIAAAKAFGVEAREIPLQSSGRIDLDTLREQLKNPVMLICLMQVCNETGIVMPIQETVSLRNELAPDASIHVDGVQGYLRLPFSMKNSGVQTYALSGHKIHASKGIGALVFAQGVRLQPQLLGGGQQNGFRSGTENTCGIAGLEAAVNAFPHQKIQQMGEMKLHLFRRLSAELPEMVVNGELALSSSHILSVAFPPVRAETLLHALESEGIIVGNGSACSAKKAKHSSVLEAMGCRPEVMESTIRISLSPMNTMEEMEKCADAIIHQVTILRRFTRR